MYVVLYVYIWEDKYNLRGYLPEILNIKIPFYVNKVDAIIVFFNSSALCLCRNYLKFKGKFYEHLQVFLALLKRMNSFFKGPRQKRIIREFSEWCADPI